jgi:hypothetical protein
MAACRQHHRRVYDISRSDRATQDADGPSPCIGQRLHSDAAGVEQTGQPGLSWPASPRLADHTSRHDHHPPLPSRHLYDRRSLTVAPLHCDQRPGIENQAHGCSATVRRCRARASS